MQVLVSSIACSPFGGSEGAYGWNACRAIARDHTVWIITHDSSRAQIDEARNKGMIPDSMHFFYLGKAKESHPNRMIARLESWTSYISFQKQVLPFARKLLTNQSFDLVHHVTYTTWRVASPLWKLPLPFVWGPISGTEQFPLPCLSLLSPASAAFEVFRIVMNWTSLLSPSVRACCRKSNQVVAIHNQAKEYLLPLRGTEKGLPVFGGFFFDPQRIDDLKRQQGYSPAGQPLRIFAAGNLEGRKGVAIALHALALAKKRGVPFLYHVTSRGPELEKLKHLANTLGLAKDVILGEGFPREEYCRSLQTFDVYLLPSLREGGGLSMMEAMLAGGVPIVADCGGPGTAVQSDCGFKIPVTHPRQMAEEICGVLEKLNANRHLLEKLGPLARARIATTYDEPTFRETINRIYQTTALP